MPAQSIHRITAEFTLTGDSGNHDDAAGQITNRVDARIREEFGSDSELHGYAGPTIAEDQLDVYRKRIASPYEMENPQTVPELHVAEAAVGDAADIALLMALSQATDREDVNEVGSSEKIEGLLGIGNILDEDPQDLAEAAERVMDGWPLAVESTVTFEIVLGVGGPDSRILIECDVEQHGSPATVPSGYERELSYEIRRVCYRYSWSGTADYEFSGEARAAVEAFARRVVPQLSE